MSKYGIKNAVLDLGFIDGCLQEHLQGDAAWQKYLWEVLDRIGQRITLNVLSTGYMIYDLGVIRGAMWLKPLPGAFSLAMDRLMEYFVEGAVDWYQLPQPFSGREHEDPVLSDDMRNEINADYVCEGRDYAIETAKRAGFTEPFIIDRIVPPKCRDGAEKPVADKPGIDEPEALGTAAEHEQSGEVEGGAAETLQSASSPIEASVSDDVAGRSHNSIPTDQIEVVRELSESMTDDEIAERLNVSRDTVIRYRKKHGIEKRRGPREGKVQWEPWQKAKLAEMKLAGTYSWSEIGEAVGKTANLCSGMWHWEKKKLGAEPDQEGVDELEDQSATTEADSPEIDTPEDEQPEKGDLSEAVAVLVPEPSPPHRLTVAHPGYAGKREDGQLHDDDWPDIKSRMDRGDTRRAIASDYDVELEDLDFFIASNERREAKQPPGEARAPL